MDYLGKTIVTVITRERSRIGQDFDFVNGNTPSFGDLFGLMAAVQGHQDVVPFIEWQKWALAYARARPKSSLARIATVVGILHDETAAGMLKGSTVGEHVFGIEADSVPPFNKQCVRRYLSRIIQSNAL